MNKYKLSKDVRLKLCRYIERGVISRDLISKIVGADSNSDVIEAMCCLYDLSEFKKMRLWYHTVCSVWDGDDVDTCFNELDCIFFRQLVENCGLLKRVDLCKLGVFKTEFKVSKTAENLKDMGLVDVFRLSNFEVVYVLSLDYYNEVFKDGEKG